MAAAPAEIRTTPTTAPEPEPAAGRFDTYLVIHKALRALLADTLATLGRMDPSDEPETRRVLDQVRQVVLLSEGHLAKEDTYVHPAMEARAPGSTQHAAGDHRTHAVAFERILAACAEVESSQGAARRAAALCLYRRFAVFMAEDLLHMNIEETENNAVLWATHSDAELAGITERIVASIPPEVLARYLRWMVVANTPVERAMLLLDVRRKLPPAAFAGLLDGLLPQLDDAGRAKLRAALA
ncbi:MAG: hemerythrin domain-containing protein [Proteobacteria bacterium]|nr:hemerythrin domain-containing protein [Pseudomonadota bacterium]